mmetsp:Transcript_39037/g.47568  ORF Transcript_39037/g.47568 Transcript_39037/m.47568 type:complete len:192 (+) Transcript_39037:381-956(+)
MFCAIGENGVGDSCQGDSGGPIFSLRDSKADKLVGVVSFGMTTDSGQIVCGDTALMGFFAKTSLIETWLNGISEFVSTRAIKSSQTPSASQNPSVLVTQSPSQSPSFMISRQDYCGRFGPFQCRRWRNRACCRVRAGVCSTKLNGASNCPFPLSTTTAAPTRCRKDQCQGLKQRRCKKRISADGLRQLKCA